ncbi:STM4015 family protein [Streptomyces sp. NPDC127068]|uniref:STM4015 family protein n=1 Tax=Streptomyces sp. NPDC127068 TaxID=3347127 RepID=UPI00365ACC3E
MISSHQETHFGLPVFDFPRHGEEVPPELPDAGAVTWRISVASYDSEEKWAEAFERFRAAVELKRVTSLIVGAWEDPYETSPQGVIDALVGAREELGELRSLFLGEITGEECEISWITQGTVTELLDAFPRLRDFTVRGGSSLVFPPVRHEALVTLTIETGGLPREVVQGVAASDFPALEELVLWLGTSEYGGDCEAADVAPILAGARLPALRRLALCNSEIQNEIAAATATAPVVAQLRDLDLSMGVLTDEGAAALLAGQPLTHLASLDLSHNYLSDELRERLRQELEPAGVALDADGDDAEEYDEGDGAIWRYVAVSE